MTETTKTPEELAAEAAALAAAEADKASEQETVVDTETDPKTGTGEENTDDTSKDEEVDYLSMSDEEIEKLGALEDQAPADKDPEVSDDSKETDAETEAAKAAETSDKETVADKADVEAKPEGAAKTPEASEASKKEASKAEDNAPTVVDPLKASDADAVAAYKQIFAPFKANGKDVQARTAEEAVRLMQMGAGHMRYKKRIAPMLTRAQTLANAGVNDEELNFLIELKNKKPEAIKKLVRDAGLDPYDIATDEAAKAADKNYRPGDYAASGKQVALQDTLEATRLQEGGVELLSHLRTSWDDNSRQMALEDPAIIEALAEQKSAGIYDQITAEIDRRQTLGQLTNEPFLTAYHQVGKEMTENGMFVQATNTPDAQQKSQIMANTKPEVLETRTIQPTSKSDKASKAAAALAPVASKPASKVAPEAILTMSDEEFEKMSGMERFV